MIGSQQKEDLSKKKKVSIFNKIDSYSNQKLDLFEQRSKMLQTLLNNQEAKKLQHFKQQQIFNLSNFATDPKHKLSCESSTSLGKNHATDGHIDHKITACTASIAKH